MSRHWFAPIDIYCERLDASFWAEPLNAVSNGAFLIGAALAFHHWRKAGGRDGAALWLIAVMTLVGIGSFLFHTFANRWSLLADVIPIAVFIYSYMFVAMRRYLALSIMGAILATLAFAGFSFGFERLWRGMLPGFTLNGSVGYLPALLAMLGVGLSCRVRARAGSEALLRAGNALLLAAGVFMLSLAFRSLDRELCGIWPVGTHPLWHILNAVVLTTLTRAAIAFKAGGRAA